MADDTTTITVSDAMWELLDSRKQRGDSFDDLLWELVEDAGWEDE